MPDPLSLEELTAPVVVFEAIAEHRDGADRGRRRVPENALVSPRSELGE